MRECTRTVNMNNMSAGSHTTTDLGESAYRMGEETSEKRNSAIFIRGLSQEPALNTSHHRLSGVFLNLDFTVLNPDHPDENDETARDDPHPVPKSSMMTKSDLNVAKNEPCENGNDTGIFHGDVIRSELVPLRRSRNSRSAPNIAGLGKRPNSSNRLSMLSNVSSDANVYIRGISKENVADYHCNPYHASETPVENQIRLNRRCSENERSSDNINTMYYKRVIYGMESYKAGYSRAMHRILSLILGLISSTFAIYKIGIISVISGELNMSMLCMAGTVATFELSRALCMSIYPFIINRHKHATPSAGLLFAGLLLTVAPLLFAIPGLLPGVNMDRNIQDSTASNIVTNNTGFDSFVSDHWFFSSNKSNASFPKNTQEVPGPQTTQDYSSNITACEQLTENQTFSNLTYFLFILASVLHGAADACLRTTIADDVEHMFNFRKLSFYSGVCAFPHFLGISSGFLLAAVVLLMANGDPGGATNWWIGCVVVASLSFITFTIDLILSVREHECSSRTADRRTQKSSAEEVVNTIGETNTSEISGTELRHILMKPSFIMTTIAAIFDVYMWSGFLLFVPAWLENEFYQSPWEIATIVGIVIGLPTVGGFIIGGLLLVEKLRLPNHNIVALAISSVLSSALLVSMMWFNCDATKELIHNVPGCNDHCVITSSAARPVCGADQTTYMSPCMAGCQDYEHRTADHVNFTDCVCMNTTSNWAIDGACDAGCVYFIPYLVVMAVSCFLVATRAVPMLAVITRLFNHQSVKIQTRAQGIYIASVTFFGTSASILLIGGLMSHVFCDVNYDECGPYNTCWIIDASLGFYAHATAAGSQTISALFMTGVFLYLRRNTTTL